MIIRASILECRWSPIIIRVIDSAHEQHQIIPFYLRHISLIQVYWKMILLSEHIDLREVIP